MVHEDWRAGRATAPPLTPQQAKRLCDMERLYEVSMSNEARTVDEIIAAVGGKEVVRTLCNLSERALQLWYSSDRVPFKYWKIIIEAGGGLVTREALASLYLAPKKRSHWGRGA